MNMHQVLITVPYSMHALLMLLVFNVLNFKVLKLISFLIYVSPHKQMYLAERANVDCSTRIIDNAKFETV